MMKKRFFTAAVLLITSLSITAQTARTYTRYVYALDTIRLKNVSITNFTTNFFNADSLSNLKIPTAKAVADYVRSKGTGGVSSGNSSAFGISSDTGSYFIFGGPIRPTFSAGVNTWGAINDGSHYSVGIESVSTYNDHITVILKGRPHNKVVSYTVTTDESIGATNTSTSGTPFYGKGPYIAGIRGYQDSAEIYIKRSVDESVLISYNGTSWSKSGTPINPNSPSWSITWSGSYLDITNISFPFYDRGQVKAELYSYNAMPDSLMALQPRVQMISDSWIRIFFYNTKCGKRFTTNAGDACGGVGTNSLPPNLGVWINFPNITMSVNPRTEDFGPAANFWFMGIVNK